MSEHDSSMSFEDRQRDCPIHRWGDIEGYLSRAQVPTSLWLTFHELIVARGQYSWNITEEDAKKFAREAVLIIERNELMPKEAFALKMIFETLIRQWIATKEREQ